MKRTLLLWPALCSLLVGVVGCPHRSPLWSPDGSSLLVLGGTSGEGVDQAASRLWLVDVAGARARRLEVPAEGHRFLAAAWVDAGAFVAFTGAWEDGYIDPGSERLWRFEASDGSWTPLSAPETSETRVKMRPPLCIGPAERRLLVYPSGDEAVVVVDVKSGKEEARLEPAELIGAGPQGGFLIYRPESGDTGGTEIVAVTSEGKDVWRRSFADIRDGIAGRFGKEPVDIVFNDTSSSHVPPAAGEGAAPPGWIGLTLVFSDVGWKDGIPGYYVRLDGASGKVLAATAATGLPGRPASRGDTALAIAAPDAGKGLPVRIVAASLAAGAEEVAPLEGARKDDVLGYSLAPDGKRIAVSILGEHPALELRELDDLGKPRRIPLE